MKKIIHLKYVFILLTVFSTYSCGKNIDNENASSSKPKLTDNESIFLDTLQYRTFKYFWNELNFENGLVKDRSTDYSPASIAATGFAIPIWAIGVEHNWITRKQASDVTLNLLNFLINSEQSESETASGFKGFYYHFLDMKTGKRMWNCELSTIDTAWLLAGLRFASQYFNQENETEIKIRELIEQVTIRVDWTWATLPDTGFYKNTVSLGWDPKNGFSDYGWTGYNESLFLYVIAAGSDYENVSTAYNQWLSKYKWENPYEGLEHVAFPPLFGHQYSHFFIDFRGIADDYMQKKRIDYFENSKRATLVQQKYAIENPLNWIGYDSLTWGLTACDGPGSDNNFDDKKFNHYAARGTSGPNNVHDDDGTIAPTAAGGSIAFAPEIVIPTLINLKEKYGNEGLWGKYGFTDAFNPTVNWYDKDYLGIDQAAIIIMIENYRTGLVWNYTMKDSVIKKGLKKLGFVNKN
ncbi:MAG: Tat pathway signal protein [Bacteroidetes bacterium]|nr:Tat pathway signal protein [Bacteroidota bacterium]MBU1114784.1 Tat pathway signal protein [Bacteroidota bacterium]MBU1797879.1 Tat pathway signal protein [Bacteroidota bacterium]